MRYVPNVLRALRAGKRGTTTAFYRSWVPCPGLAPGIWLPAGLTFRGRRSPAPPPGRPPRQQGGIDFGFHVIGVWV